MALRLGGSLCNLPAQAFRFDTLRMKLLTGLSSYGSCRQLVSRATQHSSLHVSFYQCRFSSSRTALPIRSLIRTYSGSSSKLVCQNLKHRAIVKITGSDTNALLQGIVTNDITSLLKTEQQSGQYTFMLNLQGRILHDLLLYNATKAGGSPTVLMECEKQHVKEIMQTFQKYRLRRKVEISLQPDMCVWAVWNDDVSIETLAEPLAVPIKKGTDIVANVPDPRLSNLGCRVLLPENIACSSNVDKVKDVQSEDAYTKLLYRLGVGEGSRDLPHAACFPLEANGVFLHGVSFSKGCYIGQELTARSHHTGVIRKRLMPLTFTRDDHKALPEYTVETASGKNCGKLRSSAGRYGLALLRVVDAVRDGPLVVKDADGKVVENDVKVTVPCWWPKDTDEVIKQALASSS